jgi:serine/threonine protein phosphatase 1
MSGRTFVMGDIHGNFKAYQQCMEKSGFNPEKDTLIQIGDVSDRLPETANVVEQLLSIKYLVAIRGNHDEWTRQWLVHHRMESGWLENGGKDTIFSYRQLDNQIDLKKHQYFFDQVQINYFVDSKNRVFVHGGFTHPEGPEKETDPSRCLWDRSLWENALTGETTNNPPEASLNFNEIYIGHTPTLNVKTDQPKRVFNIWNMDTGAAYPNGRLTIMDIDSKAYWQSDLTMDLYTDA